MKKILCACECSQVLTKAFRKKGFDCWSCDLSDSFGDYPQYHLKGDMFDFVDGFDAVFAFPPCTHLTWANGDKLIGKFCNRKTYEGFLFFLRCLKHPKVRMVENPLGVPSRIVRHSQIVSPDDFGSPLKKRTCLWLKALPILLPTTCRVGHSFVESMPSSSFKRSVLDFYLAEAMVNQWSDYL